MSAPAVYVLHGLLGTAYAHFGAQVTRWQRDHRVVPVDLPGHGRCPLDAGQDYLDAALVYLTALVDRFGPGRLVGASYLGGPVALRLAATRPDLVESVVLTGFAPGIEHAVFRRWLSAFHEMAGRDGALAAGYDRVHGPRWRDTLTAFTAEVDHAYAERVLVRPADLAALEVDVLLVNGSLKSHERAAAEGAARFGPRVRGAVLAGAGHIASHDAPEEFTAAVAGFWPAGVAS
jgi:pimeloyl-ACP methyl ester carboxylesterase